MLRENVTFYSLIALTNGWISYFQYKDAFFNANPDFKWYKLPAPPLRTLASRPRELDRAPQPPPHSPPQYLEPDPERTNNNSTKLDLNKKSREHAAALAAVAKPPLSMFTPGKLADESNMGGLSRLLDAAAAQSRTPNPYYSPTPFRVDTISLPDRRSHGPDSSSPNKEDTIRDLQNALSDATRVFEDDESKEGMYSHGQAGGDIFTNQDVIDQIVEKRYSTEEYYQRNWSDDEKMRSGRSCKGKRYQEFMALGGLIVNKRQRRDGQDRSIDEAYSASSSWDNGRSEESTSTTEDSKQSSAEIESEPKPEQMDLADQDNNATKTFKAADFDLDAKIAALPSLSLEKFQQKKRENKRRKKTINLKPKVQGSSHMVNSVAAPVERREIADSWRETVIGSQKRKPRKISITRFEINSLVDATEQQHHRTPELKIATEAPGGLALCGRADLLALATLAEVAASTSKLIDGPTAPAMAEPDHFSAKSSDENASMVWDTD